jgi:hypothetical protein
VGGRQAGRIKDRELRHERRRRGGSTGARAQGVGGRVRRRGFYLICPPSPLKNKKVRHCGPHPDTIKVRSRGRKRGGLFLT